MLEPPDNSFSFLLEGNSGESLIDTYEDGDDEGRMFKNILNSLGMTEAELYSEVTPNDEQQQQQDISNIPPVDVTKNEFTAGRDRLLLWYQENKEKIQTMRELRVSLATELEKKGVIKKSKEEIRNLIDYLQREEQRRKKLTEELEKFWNTARIEGFREICLQHGISPPSPLLLPNPTQPAPSENGVAPDQQSNNSGGGRTFRNLIFCGNYVDRITPTVGSRGLCTQCKVNTRDVAITPSVDPNSAEILPPYCVPPNEREECKCHQDPFPYCSACLKEDFNRQMDDKLFDDYEKTCKVVCPVCRGNLCFFSLKQISVAIVTTTTSTSVSNTQSVEYGDSSNNIENFHGMPCSFCEPIMNLIKEGISERLTNMIGDMRDKRSYLELILGYTGKTSAPSNINTTSDNFGSPQPAHPSLSHSLSYENTECIQQHDLGSPPAASLSYPSTHTNKKRKVDVVNYRPKKPRQCSHCYGYGHYKNTCKAADSSRSSEPQHRDAPFFSPSPPVENLDPFFPFD